MIITISVSTIGGCFGEEGFARLGAEVISTDTYPLGMRYLAFDAIESMARKRWPGVPIQARYRGADGSYTVERLP